MKKILYIMAICMVGLLEVPLSHAQQITQLVPDAKQKKVRERKWLNPQEKPSETVMAAWAPVEVEHIIGVRGGYGMGTVRFEPQRNAQMYIGLLNFGVWYRFDVPKQKYVGCIEIDLEYMEKAYQYETYNESGVFVGRKYSVISLPILWQPYLPLSKGGSRFYLNAGPFFNYALASTEFSFDKATGEEFYNQKYSYDMLRDNRWEYGVTVGAGLTFAIKKRFFLGLDVRYNIALSDTFKSVTKYPGNPFRSPVDQLNASLSIGYKLPTVKKEKKDKENIK